MKTAAPTEYQSVLLERALDAPRYTERHRALWRAVYKQAAATVRHYKLRWEAQQLVEYWIEIIPESASEGNTIELADLQCGFKTISEESGAEVVPIESLEQFGDNWVSAPQPSEQDRLAAALEWHEGLHPVTEHQHLPSWCDGHAYKDEEAHLEPIRGFEPLTCYTPRR